MTPAEVRAFIVEQTVPDGWALTPRVVRAHRFRNFWGIEVRRHGKVLREFRAYNVRDLMPAVLEFIERESRPAVVAVDGDGWVRSIEESAA